MLPKLLKLAIRGYRVSDWPLLQQSQLIWRVLPLPRMGWADSGVWHKQVPDNARECTAFARGCRCPLPSAPGAVTKYRASSEPRSLVLRKRLSASALDQESLRMRRVDWLPRMASPWRGASRSNSPAPG